ncbi:hypothetical protein [uncultured Roseobacter sp.]|uniref:hypothetical protein n=1 Tax=uncultured Roseobacter sp. TaxID=114847 RepID=UPI002604965B|nr:hypothetical protein [uncultured Roseobacter sp.]
MKILRDNKTTTISDFTDDEWWLVHFFVNYQNDHYDEIDETIMDHYAAQDRINSLSKIVNESDNQDPKALILNDDHYMLLVGLLYTAIHQFDELIEIEKGDSYEKYSDLLDSVHQSVWQASRIIRRERAKK